MKVMIASSTPLSASRRRGAPERAPGVGPEVGHPRTYGLRDLLRRADERLQPHRFGARDAEGRGVALLCLGVDQIEVVESALGPAWGQALLDAVERRVSAPGAGDVAPLGGGRFAVLLPPGTDVHGALWAVELMQQRASAPFRIGTHEVYVTLTAGVATSGGTSRRGEELLRDARAAL
ncbi:MAG TPA: diguanylate cyclase, partial [Longimicrobiaceae bacterium]|nr:diguanylate cyclase [Longimicrobiaceae bacterium]